MGKPGRTKKKNTGVGVDFKKVKHKVGKKLPRAQNQTDTNFKSRTISLAEQSVATDKAGQAVTTRNLTLKEVLGQCGHYSERVRKDALQGLAELVATHPDELRRHTTLVMETAAERITDGDKAVRAALRELLSGTLLPALGPAALAPFVPLMMAHVCAAMTHLAEPIRADALGFLELLMGARPDLVAAGFLAPVLQHFSDLLSKGSRGRSIKAGSLASLHGVVQSLERFLSTAIAALAGTGSGDCKAGAAGAAQQQPQEQQQQRQQQQAEAVLMWRRSQWAPAGGGAGSGAALAAAAAEGSGGEAAGSGTAGSLPPGGAAGAAAAAALLGHLLDCWSEAGPSQLAESPDLVAAQCLTAILRSCDLLLAHWGPGPAGSPAERASLAAALLKRVPPHFPMQRPAVQIPAPLAEQLVLLNVAAAQLLARFLPGAAGAAGTAGGMLGMMGGEPGSSQEQPWVERLLDWFAGVMAEGSALPAADDPFFGEAPSGQQQGGGRGKRKQAGRNGSSSGETLPAAVYQSALEGAQQVLPLLPPPRRSQLLDAAWQLWQRTSARSSARGRVLAFWQALLRDPAAAFYVPVPGGGPLLQHSEAAAWLAALPRFLFELGSSNPGASEAALRLLLGAARCAPPSSPLAASLQELQLQLAPLFAVLLPAGKAAAAGPRLHTGPLAALPPAVQELAVDLLFHFPSASEQLLRTAALVCLGGAFPTSTAVRLLEVLSAKAASGAAEPVAFCGLLLNVLSGSSAAGLRQRSWARHEALVAAACRAALGLGGPAEVGAALLPPLLAACTDGSSGASDSEDGSSNSSTWAAYGLLQLAITLAQAAAAAQQPWQPPQAVAAALPGLMLQLQLTCQQQQQQQQQEGAASQQPGSAGAGTTTSSSGSPALLLSSAEASALCLRLLVLQPGLLLPQLLAAVSSGLLGAQADASLLPVALQLLLALLREPGLRAALLEEQAAVQAAVAACRAAAEAAGGATLGGRGCQEQLRQVEGLCAAVLGSV
ncbi:hypothetical protein ABPG75_002860 [Micractinium tetrahymenae]